MWCCCEASPQTWSLVHIVSWRGRHALPHVRADMVASEYACGRHALGIDPRAPGLRGISS